jgi:hypothetical protein
VIVFGCKDEKLEKTINKQNQQDEVINTFEITLGVTLLQDDNLQSIIIIEEE